MTYYLSLYQFFLPSVLLFFTLVFFFFLNFFFFRFLSQCFNINLFVKIISYHIIKVEFRSHGCAK